MKIIIVILLLGFAINIQAQAVNFNGTIYKIKGKTILQEGTDVTKTLSLEDQAGIRDALKKQDALAKAEKKAVKAQKQAEKAKKEAEKSIKKAEKESKAIEKAQSKYEDANKDYNDAQKKYEKLKRKGKLSPNDEEKWLKKMEDLKKDIEKTKHKL